MSIFGRRNIVKFLVTTGKVSCMCRVFNATIRLRASAALAGQCARRRPVPICSAWVASQHDKAKITQFPLTGFTRRTYPRGAVYWSAPADPTRGKRALSFLYNKEEEIWWFLYENTCVHPSNQRPAQDNGAIRKAAPADG